MHASGGTEGGLGRDHALGEEGEDEEEGDEDVTDKEGVQHLGVVGAVDAVQLRLNDKLRGHDAEEELRPKLLGVGGTKVEGARERVCVATQQRSWLSCLP